MNNPQKNPESTVTELESDVSDQDLKEVAGGITAGVISAQESQQRGWNLFNGGSGSNSAFA